MRGTIEPDRKLMDLIYAECKRHKHRLVSAIQT